LVNPPTPTVKKTKNIGKPAHPHGKKNQKKGHFAPSVGAGSPTVINNSDNIGKLAHPYSIISEEKRAGLAQLSL
jgi:hypothetical protein